MLGNILFQILMFVIIWDIYLRIGGQNTNLKNRMLYLLFDVALCIWGQLIGRYIGIVPPLVAIVTLTFSYQLNKSVTSVERFFLGFYPVVLVDLARRFLATFFFPPILGITAATLNNNMVVYGTTFLCHVDGQNSRFYFTSRFYRYLESCCPTRKKEPSGFGQHASFALLFSYLFGVDI